MSLYILDTDILTLFQVNHVAVRRQVAAHAGDRLAITVITVEEQLSGWYTHMRQAKRRDAKARAYQRLADAVRAFNQWDVFSFPEPAIVRYEQLQVLKLNIGKKDLCIAAITLENAGILVTRNLRDFQRIPNLTIENWAV